MESIMSGKYTSAVGIVLLAGAMPFIASAAPDTNVAQATWKPQEIRYTYSGFTTAYSCDAAETKLEAILRALGAHPNTRVRATGCNLTRPSKDFFITVTTATAVPVDTAAKPVEPVDGNVLKQLRLERSALSQTFPAQWKTVNLSSDRRLNLQPGDCELLEGLRDHVLPKLSLEIVEDRVNCTPHQLSIQTPTLAVAALVPAQSPDQS
jgi:hypothetical protein